MTDKGKRLLETSEELAGALVDLDEALAVVFNGWTEEVVDNVRRDIKELKLERSSGDWNF